LGLLVDYRVDVHEYGLEQMVRRVWLRSCVVWAVFSLIFGTLSGPDTFKHRVIHALVPLIIGAVMLPIIRNLQFRRIYREYGRSGIYYHIGLWLFVAAVFLGPATANELGYPGVRDKLIWVLVFFLYVLPTVVFLVRLARSAFKALRGLAQALFPASDPTGADNRSPER
jgi:hypothetical protein